MHMRAMWICTYICLYVAWNEFIFIRFGLVPRATFPWKARRPNRSNSSWELWMQINNPLEYKIKTSAQTSRPNLYINIHPLCGAVLPFFLSSSIFTYSMHHPLNAFVHISKSWHIYIFSLISCVVVFYFLFQLCISAFCAVSFVRFLLFAMSRQYFSLTLSWMENPNAIASNLVSIFFLFNLFGNRSAFIPVFSFYSIWWLLKSKIFGCE